MAMEETTDITERDLLACSLAQRAMNLGGGQDLALLGTFLETHQESLLIFPGQIPPAPPGPVLPLRVFAAVLGVLADSDAHRLLGNSQ